MEKVLEFVNKTTGVYKIRGLEVEPTYWQAAIVLMLIFLLLFTVARMRYLYVHWSLGKSAISMAFWGFVLAIALEGLLILSGRTLFTEVLGWENAPKPISTVLAISRNKLVDVLGVTKESPTHESVTNDYENLSTDEMIQVRNVICKP
jgi:hypothetical protein